MSSLWKNDFRHRIELFENSLSGKGKGKAISIKIRVTGGCFHREHSPIAYRIIDSHLESYPPNNGEFSFIEHESGPELLVFVALGTAGITLAKSVIDLITVMIKARSEGAKKGDRHGYPVELIVRGFDDDEVKEEIVLRFDSHDPIDREFIKESLEKKVSTMLTKPKKKKKPSVKQKPSN
jgi:hypothetical protein